MNRNKLGFFLSLLFLITSIFNVSAATVTLDFPSNISSGQMFDVNVIIDPEGEHIAGAQLDIEFDKSSILINSITEGNFFKQSGINTVFNQGTIDDSVGKAVNIYAAILGIGNVTTSGTFIIINATSIQSINTNDISLTNIVMVNSQGEKLSIYTPESIVQTESSGVVSSDGGVPEDGDSEDVSGEAMQEPLGEALKEPTGPDNTLLVVAFGGIILILIIVYKYVIKKSGNLEK